MDVCCIAAGQSCGADVECCGESCDGGVCALTLPPYLQINRGGVCGSSSDCPPGYLCVSHECMGEPGAACCDPTNPWNCWSGGSCLGSCDLESGVCLCSGYRSGCAHDADCCDAGRCIQGQCG